MNFRVIFLLTFVLVVVIMGAERAKDRKFEASLIISEMSQQHNQSLPEEDDLPDST
ncbi:MAG: hypothetical protein SXA11_10165 [Cyanobacteriota bacterium]|nr:hypothetical protein [Cyanobacteriota bacterium]